MIETQPVRSRLLHHGPVIDLIEDLDDLLIDLDRVRQDDLAPEE